MERKISGAILKGYFEKLEDSLRVDAAIVGAGPSGLVCAWELARAGRKVAVFERTLKPGGGVWGGAMLFNEIVVQEELVPFLEELGIGHSAPEDGLVRADSVETAAALVYQAVHAGARVFNGVAAEDVLFKEDRVAGVVINFGALLRAGMHVDPLMVQAACVLDATGHGAELTSRAAAKAGIRLETPTGGVAGEKPMWAEKGEEATVENTRRVYPGLYVSGMAANGAFGAFRMGPIFGGMFLSGRKAAGLILEELG